MLDTWMPKLEEWQRAQREREEKAFRELSEVILDSVTVDGTPLRQLVEGAQVMQMRTVKDVRTLVKRSMDTHDNVRITFEGPNEAELNEWLAGIKD